MIWSDLYNRIRSHLPGCPDPLIEVHLRETAIRFCRETKIWEETIEEIYPLEGVTRYKLNLPEETRAISLLSAIQGKSESDEGESLWPSINVFGLLTFDEQPPTDKGKIEIRLILRPSDDATGMPDRIGSDYDTALIHGCIATLQSMPKKDWSNPSMVPFHHNIYTARVNDANIDRATGNNEEVLRVKPCPLF